MVKRLAQLRVPLGFLCAALALWLARPSHASLVAGIAVACAGELLRLWAAGHIDKGREITRSGPYRYMRHPLYMGSVGLGAGFALASKSWGVYLLASVYLGATLLAAMRSEEATLDARFDGAYSAYRAGVAGPMVRRFSWTRVKSNREYRAVLGLLAAFLWLAFRSGP